MDEKKLKIQSDKELNSQDNNLGSGITISELNDDCLRCILTHLSFKDKLILQRVSKRWQLIMPWNVWKGKKKLTIINGSFVLGNEDWFSYSLTSLKKLLDLCGIFIKSVVTSWFVDELEKVLELLKKSCPNLISLDLDQLTKPLIQILIQNFDNLTSINISQGCENEIYELCLKLKKLRSISIKYSNIEGKCLTALPLTSIEDFYILHSNDLLFTNLCEILKKMDNLRTLHLETVEAIRNIDKLLEDLPNRSKLENLSLRAHFIFNKEQSFQMKNLCYLTNLQQLVLTGPQVVYDEALTIIGNTCEKLRVVSIIDSHKLTDAGWQNFAKLTSLEELVVGRLYTVTDKWLRCLQTSSLKSLLCFEINTTNESLKFLLESAKRLKCLDVTSCPKVDFNMLIMDASAQIESRPRYESLELRIDMEENNHEVKNISSRLSIKMYT